MQKRQLKGLNGRDLQNIPVDEVVRAVRGMSLPLPDGSAEKKKLVTIYLDPSTIRYFKKAADKHHTKYQRFMRAVLAQYAANH